MTIRRIRAFRQWQPFRFGTPHAVAAIALTVLPNGGFSMWWAYCHSFGES